MAPDAAAVLRKVSTFDAGMHALDDPTSAVLQHVSLRVPDGADKRLDDCPCGRGLDTREDVVDPKEFELGGGQYLSSGRHTYADIVRDVTGA